MESVYPQYRFELGQQRYGIGIVGAGSIIRDAHLPAYRKAGLPVVGIYDRDAARARALADSAGIGAYASLQELLADPAVAVVDIAVPPQAQKQIVAQAAAAGKHMLCQKPLALDYAEAADIVRIGERAGVKLAVNQQMRWEPLVAAAHNLIGRGWIGEPLTVNIQVSIMTPWDTWPWLAASPMLDLMYHSIHYFDSVRHLIGLPAYVYSSLAKFPGQRSAAETRSITVFEYGDDKRAIIAVNHNNKFDDTYATLRIEGTDGIVKGTIGLLYNYPEGRPDTLEYCSGRLYPGQWFSHRIEDSWFPDAFIGTMGELQRAIEEDREPRNSGRDVLETMQIVHAAYRSMRDKRAVPPGEIAGEHPL